MTQIMMPESQEKFANCCLCHEQFSWEELYVPEKHITQGILQNKTQKKDFFLNLGNIHLVTYCVACFNRQKSFRSKPFYYESTYEMLVNYANQAKETTIIGALTEANRRKSMRINAPLFYKIKNFTPEMFNVRGFLPHPLFIIDLFNLDESEDSPLPISQDHLMILLQTHFYCMNFYSSSFPYFKAVRMYVESNMERIGIPGDFESPFCVNAENIAQNLTEKTPYTAPDYPHRQPRRRLKTHL